MNSNTVKSEKFDHLHLAYHFTVSLKKIKNGIKNNKYIKLCCRKVIMTVNVDFNSLASISIPSLSLSGIYS